MNGMPFMDMNMNSSGFDNYNQNYLYNNLERINNRINRLEKQVRILENRINRMNNNPTFIKNDFDDNNNMYML